MHQRAQDVSAAANRPHEQARSNHQQEQSPRSDYGSVPGSEMPAAVYVSVFVAFMWVLVASCFAFARDADVGLALGIAAVLAIVFFALPVLVCRTARSCSQADRDEPRDFLSCRVETATGPLTGGSAWLQVLLIPAALALAATLIGVTSLLVH
jgi:hypothetical protein